MSLTGLHFSAIVWAHCSISLACISFSGGSPQGRASPCAVCVNDAAATPKLNGGSRAQRITASS